MNHHLTSLTATEAPCKYEIPDIHLHHERTYNGQDVYYARGQFYDIPHNASFRPNGYRYAQTSEALSGFFEVLTQQIGDYASQLTMLAMDEWAKVEEGFWIIYNQCAALGAE